MRKRIIVPGALLAVTLLALALVGCTKPLTMSIGEPKNGASVTASNIPLRVYVSDPKATVWINDSQTDVSKTRSGTGYISTTIDLSEGENPIRVVAARGFKKGAWKDTVENMVTVTYTPK